MHVRRTAKMTPWVNMVSLCPHVFNCCIGNRYIHTYVHTYTDSDLKDSTDSYHPSKVYIHTHTHTHTYIHTYIHTHIHTYTDSDLKDSTDSYHPNKV